MNVVLIALIVGSVFAGLVNGKIDILSGAMIESARGAVTIALSLIGGMALWLGLLAIVDKAGLMRAIARLLLPILKRLFPDIPHDHPALGAMVMNLASNVLGMDNAATAFGIRAMRALDTLNGRPGVATNAMVLFLAINTAGIQAFPVSVVAARAAINPATAGAIVLPAMMVSVTAALMALVWAKLFERVPYFVRSRPPLAHKPLAAQQEEAASAARPEASLAQKLTALAIAVALGGALLYRVVVVAQGGVGPGGVVRNLSGWLLALLAAAVLVYGLAVGVKVYETAVAGAREGFDIAVRILPFLVLILVGVGMFRASGLMDILVALLTPVTSAVGMPPAVLPQALVRPLSGSGALGLLIDTLKTYGPDSDEGFVASVIYGSSETTFYVLAVYFGAIGVRSIRHALAACLFADLTGVLLAVWIARWFH